MLEEIAVNDTGESVSLAMSFRLTLMSERDFIAMNIEARIPYSQAFENMI